MESSQQASSRHDGVDCWRKCYLHDLRSCLCLLYRQEPHRTDPTRVLEVPILGTVCLLSSSLTIWRAEKAIEGERLASFTLWLGATIVLAVAFLAGTAIEWKKLIYQDDLTISTNLFGTTFYSLVGLHATHVVVGLFLLANPHLLPVRLGRLPAKRAFWRRCSLLALRRRRVDRGVYGRLRHRAVSGNDNGMQNKARESLSRCRRARHGRSFSHLGSLFVSRAWSQAREWVSPALFLSAAV